MKSDSDESQAMTVRKLMGLLSKCHPEMPVVVSGYEGGYGDAVFGGVIYIFAARDCDNLIGKYDEEIYHGIGDPEPFEAILLSRYSFDKKQNL